MFLVVKLMCDMIFDNKNIDREPVRINLNDPQYPERVKVILGPKAPEHLDMIGNLALLEMPGIGFCGSRKSSEKGLNTAKDCAEQAVQNNVSVISGNAAGVDFEAHFNSLKAGGKTILVLPEGINHFRIRKALDPVWDWERVLVISQFQPNEPWGTFRAMKRNQLIIALSRVIIAIEAGDTGGTLNTGQETLKFGLPLFVVHYQDMTVDVRSGNQILLAQGATKLSKSKATNRANLTKVLENIKEDKLLKHGLPQGDMLRVTS